MKNLDYNKFKVTQGGKRLEMFEKPIKKVFLYSILLLLFFVFSYIYIVSTGMKSTTLIPMTTILFLGMVLSLFFQFLDMFLHYLSLGRKKWNILYAQILQLMTLRAITGFFVYIFEGQGTEGMTQRTVPCAIIIYR